MDERFGKRFGNRKLWIGLGALAVVFLCLLLCGAGTMFATVTRSGPVQGVIPQVDGEGGAAPFTHFGHSGMGRTGPLGLLFTGIGLIFRVLAFGLLLLLLVGVIRRLFWRHRYCGPRYRGERPEGKKPGARPGWGPKHWHQHHKHWGPPPWWGEAPESGGDEFASEEPWEADEESEADIGDAPA